MPIGGIYICKSKCKKSKVVPVLKFNFFNWYSGGGVQLGPLGIAATNRPIVPAQGDYDDREIGGMIGRRNRDTWRKPFPVPLCPQ
jgi:hypothetical protein